MDAVRSSFRDISPSIDLDEVFRGTIVDIADPLQRGRARIRIFGIHTAKMTKEGVEGIPDEELPWAEQIAPTAGGSSGAGYFSVPTVGSIVWGFFADGDHLHPMYFGVQMGMTAGGTDGGGSGGSSGSGEGEAPISGPPPKYDGSSGVKLLPDGRVDLKTVKGIDSIQCQAGVDIASMHPEVVAKMGAMAEEYEQLTGKKLVISEGYRSYDEQVRVKQKYGREAATPGKSTHGYGTTFDIARSQIATVESSLKAKGQDPSAFFKKHGFNRPLLNAKVPENWHLEASAYITPQMQADRASLSTGKKPGSAYLTAEQKAYYA